MKTTLRQFFALAGSIALLTAPVAPLIAAQSDLEPFEASAVLAPAAVQADEELLAYDMSRIISTQTRLIRYEATEYQRKVAEQRARAFMAAHRRSVAAAATKPTARTKTKEAPPKTVAKKTPKSQPSEPEVKTATPGKKKKSTEVADNRKEQPKKPSKPEVETPAEPKSKETRIAEEPKALPRYIAVDTVKDKRAAPNAKKVVMIWDTHAEKLVGNNIYDVTNPPRVGETKVFETYSAEYIGAGL